MPLKAFTLLEMLLALILAALVTRLGFYGLHLFQQHYRQYSGNSSQIVDVKHLEWLLAHDFSASQYLTAHDSTLFSVHFDSLEIRYRMADSLVIRSYLEYQDTFRCQVTNMATMCAGKAVTNGLIDALEMSLWPVGEAYPLKYFKVYSAEQRIQFELKYVR